MFQVVVCPPFRAKPLLEPLLIYLTESKTFVLADIWLNNWVAWQAAVMASERLPLLAAGTSEVDTSLSYGSDGYWTDSGTTRGHRRNKRPSFGKLSIIDSNDNTEESGGVKMGRTLGLGTAIMLMISCCCGTGIFVSPVGVTQSVGSVGLTLCVWAFCGVFSMVLALCYAELGTAIPVAGGDYAYIQTLLGPFPAFLCLWMLVVLVAPAAATIMGLAVAEYLAGMLDLDCHTWIVLLVAFLTMCKYREVSNIRSTKSQHFNVSRLVLQLSLPNPLKLGVKSRMKM